MNDSLADEQHEFVRELVIVARRWRNRFDERLRTIGMSQARWAALYWLSNAPDGLSQTALAERAGVEAPTLVRIIDLLEAQGLVRRQVSERDRRSKVVKLTPEAAPVIAEIEAVADALRREVLKDIGPDDLRLTLQILRRLRTALGADAMDQALMSDASL